MEVGTFQHALKIREDLCQGCSHCMVVCPTEALRVRNGKAILMNNRCVDCGKCFRECPSGAIVIDQDDFNFIYDYKYRIALVPAIFSGLFPEEITLNQVNSALLGLGFTHVYEVENGVEILNEQIIKYAHEHPEIKPLISSFCPAIVRLIQVKFPSLVDNIMLLKPPLDISANFLKKELIDKGALEKEIGIFYVTPCAAKIAAIKEPVGEEKSNITGAINMDVLYNKVYRQVIKKSTELCAVPTPVNLPQKSRNWSLTGGEANNVLGRSLAIDEIHNVMDFLEKIENEEITEIDFLELRACDESCAGGVLTHGNRFLTVERMRKQKTSNQSINSNINHPDAFRPITELKEYLSENNAIGPISPRSILMLDNDMGEAMKKMDKINKLMKVLPMIDCSICGAPSCQALALDIVNNDAELKQCIFVQRTMEEKSEITPDEGRKILREIWGFEKTNKYRSIK